MDSQDTRARLLYKLEKNGNRMSIRDLIPIHHYCNVSYEEECKSNIKLIEKMRREGVIRIDDGIVSLRDDYIDLSEVVKDFHNLVYNKAVYKENINYIIHNNCENDEECKFFNKCIKKYDLNLKYVNNKHEIYSHNYKNHRVLYNKLFNILALKCPNSEIKPIKFK